MRVLWATCGLAVAASALTGVLIGVYIDGVKDEREAETPTSTWITGRPSTVEITTTTTRVIATTDQVSAPRDPTTTKPTTRTTEAPPVTTEPTTEAPPVTTTTTRTRNTAWPCGPLNPFPPPQCDD